MRRLCPQKNGMDVALEQVGGDTVGDDRGVPPHQREEGIPPQSREFVADVEQLPQVRIEVGASGVVPAVLTWTPASCRCRARWRAG